MRLCVLDTETTGLEATAQFVELASVTFDYESAASPAFNNIMYFESLANPGIPIPPEAKATHHITEEDVKDALPPASVLKQHEADVGRVDLFVAHNAPYDRGILAFVDETYRDAKKWIDTVQCARHTWPEAPGFSNQVLRYWLDLKLDLPPGLYPHRALYDAIVTVGILMELLKVWTPLELRDLSTKPALLHMCYLKKYKGILWKNVPKDYLQWVVKQTDMDWNIRHTAMYYLNNAEGRLQL